MAPDSQASAPGHGANGSGVPARAPPRHEGRPTPPTAVNPAAEAAVAQLLRTLGEDPERPSLQGTPRRVVRALLELTQGYEQDPGEILSTVFDEAYDDLVLVRRIPFVSICEHHLLPIRGHATVAYLPRDGVVGLSKLSRLVQAFAKRLQVQERMTREIAEALLEHLEPRGSAVIIEAEHACMSLRGVRTPATMVTTSFHGELDAPDEREDLLALARAASRGDPGW